MVSGFTWMALLMPWSCWGKTTPGGYPWEAIKQHSFKTMLLRKTQFRNQSFWNQIWSLFCLFLVTFSARHKLIHLRTSKSDFQHKNYEIRNVGFSWSNRLIDKVLIFDCVARENPDSSWNSRDGQIVSFSSSFGVISRFGFFFQCVTTYGSVELIWTVNLCWTFWWWEKRMCDWWLRLHWIMIGAKKICGGYTKSPLI